MHSSVNELILNPETGDSVVDLQKYVDELSLCVFMKHRETALKPRNITCEVTRSKEQQQTRNQIVSAWYQDQILNTVIISVFYFPTDEVTDSSKHVQT